MIQQSPTERAHVYGPSTVGHGEAQCVYCFGTNRENAIIGGDCPARPKAPASQAAQPADADGVERLRMFLEILSAAGGIQDATDYRWNWINAFCSEHEGREPDTFNTANQRGFTTVSHDTDSDSGVVRLTEDGRAWLAATPKAPTSTAETSEQDELEQEAFSHANNTNVPINTRLFITALWRAYCDVICVPRGDGSTPPAPDDDLRAALEENERLRAALAAKPWPPTEDELRQMLGRIVGAWWSAAAGREIQEGKRRLNPEDVKGMYAVRDALAPYVALAALKENRRG